MTTTHTTPRGARPRRSLVALLVLSLLVASHAVWDHVERRRLVARIDAIHGQGERVTMTTPAADSAAGRLYAAAALLCTGLPDVWQVAQTRQAQDAGAGDETVRTARVATLLQAGDTALALADEAAALNFDGVPAGTDFTYLTAGLGALTHLIAARTEALAVQGQGDAAVHSAITGLRARRPLIDTTFPVAGIDVGTVLGTTRPSPDALRALDAALAEADDPQRVLHQVEAARARELEQVWRYAFGPSPMLPRHQTLPMRGLGLRVWRPWLARQVSRDLDTWAEVMAIARQSPAARARLLAPHDERRRNSPPPPGFVRGRWFMGYPASVAWQRLSAAVQHDTLADDRAARVAVAIERYRRDHDDAVPATLDALVPAYLTALPLDPFADAPLRFLRTDTTYVVYSVGPDGRDDGGDLQVPPPVHTPSGELYRPESADVGLAVPSAPRPRP